MKNFDYKKYLKNNPLLNEDHFQGHEGGGIPDSDVEHEDHEHEWEDTGDEEGTFTGEEECKVCGLRRSVYEEDGGFEDYEGPSIADIASEPENIENWLTKEDLPLKGKENVDSYIKKWNDKMKGSSRSTAKDWVDGIKGISKEDKESILKGIKGKISKSQLREAIKKIINEKIRS